MQTRVHDLISPEPRGTPALQMLPELHLVISQFLKYYSCVSFPNQHITAIEEPKHCIFHHEEA